MIMLRFKVMPSGAKLENFKVFGQTRLTKKRNSHSHLHALMWPVICGKCKTQCLDNISDLIQAKRLLKKLE